MCADTRSLPEAGRKRRWLIGGYHHFFSHVGSCGYYIELKSRLTCFNILLMKFIRSSITLLSQFSLWRCNIEKGGKYFLSFQDMKDICFSGAIFTLEVNKRPGAA